MKYSLLKFNIIARSFATQNVSKFKQVSQKVNISTPSLLPQEDEPEKTHSLEKTGPKNGEIYPLPVINSKLIALQQGYYDAFERDPTSAYYTMKVKDVVYHVFNAARIPLGRMCTKIAFAIQGRNSPHYKPNKIDYLDMCVIVNAKYAFLTGKKLEQKLYRHHTGHPGGLKEIKAKHYLEKNATEMLTRAIKGMLPKNKMRKLFITKIQIFEEGSHNLQNKGLPQFGKSNPIDYNVIFGTTDINKDDTVIVATNVLEKDFPDEMKDIPREINPLLEKPAYMNDSEFKFNKKIAEKYAKYSKHQMFKNYRRLRCMSYRNI